jgi:purine-binding chemotaxis protein CheW
MEEELLPSAEETRRVLGNRAAALSRGRVDEARVETLQVLAFLLGAESYGVELAHVREVFPLADLTELPGTPSFVLGIVNLRGKVLSVLDLRKFLDLPGGRRGDHDRVIVLASEAMEFGILCDVIVGAIEVPLSTLEPPLPTMTGLRRECLKGLTQDRMAILDAARLLSDGSIIVREDA